MDPEEPKMIAEAVSSILNGESVFDRAHVAEKIAGKFSQDSIIDEFVEEYKKAISACGDS